MTEDATMLGRGQVVIEPTTDKRMFSLMEVAQETGIAMPILLRYKREHPDRIPSIGSGAQQRFPEEAFAIFAEIRDEESQERDLPRRGGFGLLSLPRIRRAKKQPEEEPSTAEGASPAAAAAPSAVEELPPAVREEPPAVEEQAAPVEAEPSAVAGAPAAMEATASTVGEATLTLKDVSDQLGIAYPTVARYAAKFPDRIPYEGDGRQRRFPPEAIAIFEQIRKESKPGRPPKSKTSRAPKPKAVQPAAAPVAASRLVPMAAHFDERGLMQRIERLEREHEQLEALVRTLREELRRPLRATISSD